METWELSFEEFSRKAKTIRMPNYYDDYYRLGKRHLRGYTYYIYIDENLKTINPYTEKDQGKKCIKRVYDTMSREGVLEKAFIFILQYAFDNDLLIPALCSDEIINRQKQFLEIPR